MPTCTEEWVNAADGSKIYEQSWKPAPETTIKATLVLAHGLGEHISRYTHVFTVFAQSGIRVRAFDQRGFGQTGKKNGVLGHNEGFAKVMEDLKACEDRVRVEGKPHFLFGHSMGGGIALRYATLHGEGLRGVIASSPLIMSGSSTTVSAPKYWGIRLLSNVVGSAVVRSPVDADLLTAVPEANQQYKDDPLVHDYVSMCTARDIVLNGENLLRRDYALVKVPILITFGEKDSITRYVPNEVTHVQQPLARGNLSFSLKFVNFFFVKS
ncbi:hypothetical protein HK097_008072 [Rhizophlyctis rosea]|uniref:Serine aminopeptidase S33 domain-containing protein n=1 Tax=Rhizophlyctis rosea TaxID=64517 RepID=A0AAD5SIL8_9FUNG|nr:hypothetical protein HK097_008072 [Rhizophlyctis rosea]